MKKSILLSLFTFLSMNLFAQTGDVVFFSENGERFFVILNGVKYNDKAETNYKVQNLNAAPYSLKILFEDVTLGSINDKIYVEPNEEKTFAVKLKKIGETEKTFKRIGQNLNPLQSQNSADKNNQEINNTNEKYLVKMLSVRKLTPAPAANTAQNNNNNNTQAAPQNNTQVRSNVNANTNANTNANVNVKSSTTSTTTNTTTVANPNSANISMNINVTDNGFNETSNVNSTSTTTTTSSNTQQNAYVMPGYNGPIGCPWPMKDSDFNQAKNTINSKNFEDSKLQIAKQVISSNCLFASQVREVMMLFTFEGSKLDFAKYAYGYTYDKGNYFKVNDAFQFETSISELNEYIGGR